MFVAFMMFSLAITASGTARFSVALGLGQATGWVAGAVFDFAKDVLPLVLLVLPTKRAILVIVPLAVAWIGLVTYSCLATGATVSLAIGAIERGAAQTMQARSGIESELGSTEQQQAALSAHLTPRPAKAVQAAIAAEAVAPGVWRDSRECLAIRDSTYFQRACAKVLDLRRELAAAEDYERLAARAEDLHKRLAATPIVPLTDPLPETFESTLGLWLPVNGKAGLALLLTVVIEILSTIGPATMGYLQEKTGTEQANIETTTAVARRETGRTATTLPGGTAGASPRGGRHVGRPRGSKLSLVSSGSEGAAIRETGDPIPSSAVSKASASQFKSGRPFTDMSAEIQGSDGPPVHRPNEGMRYLTAWAATGLIGATISNVLAANWPAGTDPSALWRGVFLTIALVVTAIPALLALVKSHPGPIAAVSDGSAGRIPGVSGSLPPESPGPRF
jgi:hypothetical protein